jgi:hypothetical protein
VAAALVSPGCTRKLDPRQYGEVIHEVPKFRGTEKPYPMPQLDEPAGSTEKGSK